MAIDVRTAMKLGSLVNAELLAGEKGLDRIVRSVDVIEVPDAAIWFQKDSLLLTTLYALRDDLDGQLQMLEDIHAVRGAALVIFSPERYLYGTIDQKLLAKA